MTAKISVIMASTSDWETMKEACQILDDFGVSYEKKVVSAHRTPELMYENAQNARKKGIKNNIAGAGGAAHL
ncbi:AIR carboxylase family protein, partial [Enterococcus faecium]|uniref:AIR carboxylase family protein n=1 Tax=Enterococcus faecium TaxID=1352 RepID=UPI003CC58CE1